MPETSLKLRGLRPASAGTVPRQPSPADLHPSSVSVLKTVLNTLSLDVPLVSGICPCLSWPREKHEGEHAMNIPRRISPIGAILFPAHRNHQPLRFTRTSHAFSWLARSEERRVGKECRSRWS